MRFLKKFVFIVLLLVITFFVYRMINPTGAEALLFDIKSFSNATIGTSFSLTETPQEQTGVLLNQTGFVVDETGILQELTGNEEELLLNDLPLSEDNIVDPVVETGSTPSITPSAQVSPSVVTPPKNVVAPKTTPKTTPKVAPSSSNTDVNTIINNFK